MLKETQLFSILIADDNEINRLLLSHQLEQYSQNITMAKNGNEALEYFQNYKFDLILLDLQMPGYSGFELIKHCRVKECVNTNTPTVAITAHARDSQRKDIIALGFDECLIKPVLAEQLAEIINLWLPEKPKNKNTSSSPDYIQIMLDKTNYNYALTHTIFSKLFNELPEQLASIKNLMEIEQFKNAMDLAHKLLGTVSFCGFNDIKEPCAQLESALLNQKNSEGWYYFNQVQERTQELCAQQDYIMNKLNNELNPQ